MAARPAAVPLPLVETAPCPHRTARPLQEIDCPSCTGSVKVKVYGCDLFGQVAIAKDIGLPVCHGCPHHPLNRGESKPDDPKVGVVIGSYRWPELVDLQLRLVRSTCGPVPVLVSSDRPEDAKTLEGICRRHGATLTVSPDRLGHTAGDLAAYSRGVEWGAVRGLAVVAKLSQRLLLTAPRWLQEGAADLLVSGLALSSRRCVGPFAYPLRTEGALLDVAAWSDPTVLAELGALRHGGGGCGRTAEVLVSRLVASRGWAYWPWGLIPERRDAVVPGVVWHDSHGPEDYRRLASRLGVTLPKDFRTDGWGWELARGEYNYG